MVNETLITFDLTYLYLFLALASFVIIKFIKKDFDGQDLVNSFINITNRFMLFIISITFMFCFILQLIDNSNTYVLDFLKETFKIMAYYCLLQYGVFYLLKFINWIREFAKENDLLYMSYFNKKFNGGKK